MARGIGEAASLLSFCTPCDFVHARPVSREWHALLIRRMDAVASIYRLAAMLSRGKGRSTCGRGVPPQGPDREGIAYPTGQYESDRIRPCRWHRLMSRQTRANTCAKLATLLATRRQSGASLVVHRTNCVRARILGAIAGAGASNIATGTKNGGGSLDGGLRALQADNTTMQLAIASLLDVYSREC